MPTVILYLYFLLSLSPLSHEPYCRSSNILQFFFFKVTVYFFSPLFLYLHFFKFSVYPSSFPRALFFPPSLNSHFSPPLGGGGVKMKNIDPLVVVEHFYLDLKNDNEYQYRHSSTSKYYSIIRIQRINNTNTFISGFCISWF